MPSSSQTTQRLPHTGQRTCHDSDGCEIPCENSGQDAAFTTGSTWPEPRFADRGDLVLDRLTGLSWTGCANIAGFPMTWQESLDYIAHMNETQVYGFSDWRMPNRRELRSLISHQTRSPALSEGHPFREVFGNWYWSSTTAAAAKDHAWYVNLDGGRMFYGGKDQSFMLWPVRGQAGQSLAQTGQKDCFDAGGRTIPCPGSGQDGEYRSGAAWPEPRFETQAEGIRDHLTGRCWYRGSGLESGPVSWAQALASVEALRASTGDPRWRLPNINELESLVDCARFQPALADGHPFGKVAEIYWSSTTSLYEPDWAWALYMDKGAIGVGQKAFARFYVWAVSD